MKQMPTVEISPNFTVDDIHKIREASYNFTKNMSPDELINLYNNEGIAVHEEIQRLRAARIAEEELKKHTA